MTRIMKLSGVCRYAIGLLAISSVVFAKAKKPKKTKLQIDVETRFKGKDESIWYASMFVAAHKYFGVDQRYATGVPTDEDYIFYRKFPMPVLKKLHPRLDKVCKTGPFECINDIGMNAKKSGTMWRFLESGKKRNRTAYAPFNTVFEYFQYVQTAQYFLCWYAMTENKFFKSYESKYPCLMELDNLDSVPVKKKAAVDKLRKSKTANFVPFKNYKFVKSKYYNVITDIRDLPVSRNNIFECLRLRVCPNPCYGRKNGGNFDGKTIDDLGNPCKGLIDSTCGMDPSHNTNFEGLKKNKFNVSCNCSGSIKGFEWRNNLRFCVDKDECYDKTATCPENRICRDTIKGYECTCPRGYVAPSETADCERTALISKNAKYLKYNPEMDRVDENNFFEQAMIFLGLSDAAYQLECTSYYCLFALVLFVKLLNKIV